MAKCSTEPCFLQELCSVTAGQHSVWGLSGNMAPSAKHGIKDTSLNVLGNPLLPTTAWGSVIS